MTPEAVLGGGSAGRSMVFAGAWSVGGKVVAKLIDLATLIILTGILEPADFGLVAMAMAVILVIEAITSVPIEAPILRIRDPGKDVYDTAFTLTIIRAGIIFLLVALLAKPLALYFQEDRLVPLLLVLSLAPSLRGCLSPRMAGFVRIYNMKPEAFMDVSSKIVSLITVTVVALATKSYWAIAAGTVTTTLVLNLLSYWFAPYRPRLSISRWKQFSDVVTWNTVAQFLEAMNWQFDQFLLGRFLGSAAFGQYSVSRTLSEIPEQAAVLPLKRPMVSAFTQAAGVDELRALWLSFANGVLFAIAPFLLMLAVLSPSVVYVLLGPGWEDSSPYLAGLALSIIPTLPNVPLHPLAVSIYKARLVALRIAVQFAVTLPVVTLAVIYTGAMGAIIAKGLIGLAMTLYVAFLIRTHIGLSLRAQFNALWRTGIGLMMLAAFVYLIGDTGAPAGDGNRIAAALRLIATGGLGLLVYLGFVLLLWRISGRPRTIEHAIMAALAKLLERR